MQTAFQCYLREQLNTKLSDESSRLLFRYEWARLRSFETFTASDVSAIRLAQHGFFYSGNGTSVQCYSCGFTFEDWHSSKHVWAIHTTLRPDCPFVRGDKDADNVPIHGDGTGGTTRDIEAEQKPVTPATTEKEVGCSSLAIYSPEKEKQAVDENKRLKDLLTCKICVDNDACVVFLPCGHMVSCDKCAHALRKCPICRVRIAGQVKSLMK
ncbi:E3 ubiquitin-protein ligase XIAP-like [Dreissena polymorpha]|uniref:RING-type domain-containing protein n=1 Tax=Dreissena polymorpha TaxID=45954 RepID=A0A9D4CPX5_DREPO|nr:E3 ubiquitin-protein ligase XIAP-like [Dreissena polymorpha]KAH3728716.1 hypothetical protein DPMN_054676 [Dreissena polymorpha]